MAMLLVPWALGCFSCNSAQQARLGLAAPAWAGALIITIAILGLSVLARLVVRRGVR